MNSSANGFAESITTDQRSPVIDCVVSEENNEKLYALTKNAVSNIENYCVLYCILIAYLAQIHFVQNSKTLNLPRKHFRLIN